MYLKDKKITLHIRVSKDMLDALSKDYEVYKGVNNCYNLSFSDYLRSILKVHITR